MKHRLPTRIAVDLSVTTSADIPYQGDATVYDQLGATGSVGAGAAQAGETIYDHASATGSITGATVLPSETTYA